MKNTLKLSALIISLFLCCNSFSQNVIGKWKNIDDKTGEAKSIINVYEEDGKLYGQIVELLNSDPDAVCDCSGNKAGQKILGMVIIDGLKKEGKYWTKDKGIFDPEKDTYYDVKIWEEDGKLMVRGYIGFLHRTQVWVKA